MSCYQLGGDAPVGAPLALSHDRHSPLWQRASRQLTPGALARLLCVLLSFVGGRA
jgi:hypothetical protein